MDRIEIFVLVLAYLVMVYVVLSYLAMYLGVYPYREA